MSESPGPASEFYELINKQLYLDAVRWVADMQERGTDPTTQEEVVRRLVSMRVVFGACEQAGRDEAAVADLETLLVRGGPIARGVEHVCGASHARLFAAYAACVRAAHCALVDDVDGTEEAIRTAVAALLARGAPGLDVRLDVRRAFAEAEDRPVAWVQETCMALHGRLGDDGWVAMSVLDLVRHFMGRPREVISPQPSVIGGGDDDHDA